MATLRFIAETDQIVSPAIHDLVERLRVAVREDLSDTVWKCWIREASGGFSLQLQQTRRVAPYGGRGDKTLLTYSCGGVADFVVNDATEWLRIQAEQSVPARRRRRPKAPKGSGPARG